MSKLEINSSYKLEIPRKIDRDFVGLALILLSSVLLGVWAVKGTIALRNILLGVETVLSIAYCYGFFRSSSQKIPLKNWVPIIMLVMMFCWVIFHYFFLSRFPDIQLHELKSTWFRSLLASIVGFGTGLAILKRPSAINLLWLGILGSFTYLFYQYIPKAVALKSLAAPDYGHYIFYGKINGVLAGTIVVAGLFGTLLDTIKRERWLVVVSIAALTFIGLAVTLYAQIFIFDARSGVGLSVILLAIFLLIIAGSCAAIIGGKFHAIDSSVAKYCLTLFFALALTFMAACGIKEHLQRQPGWSSMWEDSKIAVQVDRYPNWQDPKKLNYPFNEMGRAVHGNTYERIAWATAGIKIFLPQNPYGLGVLRNPFTILMKEAYPNGSTNLASTHSAWVEVGLAFGYPALFLLIGSLFFLGCLALNSKSDFKFTAFMLSVGIACLYTVGEISSQHGIEILFFLIAFSAAVLLPLKFEDLKHF